MIFTKEIEIDSLSMHDGFETLNAIIFKNPRAPKVNFLKLAGYGQFSKSGLFGRPKLGYNISR